jgi:formylglycine-generating enzyme required for sulfatase activity
VISRFHRAAGLVAALALLLLAGCEQKPAPASSPTRAEPASGPKTVKTPSGDMVLIPSGRFMMGVNDGPIDAKPAHPIRLDSFLMDQHEVTQAAYETVIGNNPSRRKSPRNPVEQVTWIAAVKFCNARSVKEGLTPCYNPRTWECDFAANGYRLPTEAEWEYACRAGSTNQYYFGDRPEELKQYAWFETNSDSKPHPVGQRKPNAWDLYDMSGNVWEWCQDYYETKYYRNSPVDNPHGPAEGEKRVLRGGAWSSSADNCTSFVRNCDESGATDVCLTMDSNGFRCVRRP